MTSPKTKRRPGRVPSSPAVRASLLRVGAPTRPALRWHGGKWVLAPWIIAHFPPHRMYVEPFGGAASVLLRKEPSFGEVYNDLDGDVVNFFKVCRNPILAPQLVSQIQLTPFARREFEDAYIESVDPLERARNLAVISFMGFGSNAHSGRSTGFRSNSNRSGTTPANDWRNWGDYGLPQIVERLRGVVVENRNAFDLMPQHDSPTTLFYVDPPYIWDTRSGTSPQKRYSFEMDDADHRRLIKALRSLKGMVLLSGYPSDMYDGALKGWERIAVDAHADGGLKRTEVLWLNPLASKRLSKVRPGGQQLKMFEEA